MALTKSIAIGCVALILVIGVLAGCAVGGIFLLGLGSVAERAEAEGVEFGKGSDQRGCQDEAFRHLRAAIRNHDLIKRRETQMFLYGCFQTSRATPEYCAGAPREDAFLEVRRWSQEECRKEGLGNDDACVSLFMEVSDVCLGKTKHKGDK